MKLGYRYRVYPDQVVREFITRQDGCNRFIWNHFVALQFETGSYMTYHEMSHYLTHVLKPNHPWLNDVQAQSLQKSLKDLSLAVRNHLRNPKVFDKPKFKKRGWRQSCCFPQYTFVNKESSTVSIPKCRDNPIKIILHRELPEYTMCTIVKESDDRYYACFNIERDSKERVNVIDVEHLGIDLGLKDLIITSKGEVVKPPKFLRRNETNLERKHRSLSNKIKGSRRWMKSRKRLCRVHASVKRQRQDFLHKLTNRLVNENNAVAVESLSVKNLAKNHKLAKSIMDASWGMFCSMLAYKLPLQGKIFTSCGGLFPSTQTCSTCNNQTGPKGMNNLKIREWLCQVCKTSHDRDINAAKNIGLEGDRLYLTA